ncbi:MAG: DUF2505 domain-containing protein [Mycobacterium sp.]|nr:DUF2505 domain-containing protein [Mycobacterium sp.]
MARSFDVSTVNRASVEEVRSALGSEQYWLDRLEAYGGNGAITLDSLVVNTDGGIALATTQDLRRGVLPAPFSNALPSRLTLLRAETWRPLGDGRVSGEVLISASGLAGSALGTADLAPAPQGSSLRFAGSVTVGIPLVGGQIEKFIAALIVKEIPGVGRFTSDWIATHA